VYAHTNKQAHAHAYTHKHKPRGTPCTQAEEVLSIHACARAHPEACANFVCAQVEEALYEQETTGVGAMQSKLLGLQEEIGEASNKLRASEARVAQNLKRVDELKAEAVSSLLSLGSMCSCVLFLGPSGSVCQQCSGSCVAPVCWRMCSTAQGMVTNVDVVGRRMR